MSTHKTWCKIHFARNGFSESDFWRSPEKRWITTSSSNSTTFLKRKQESKFWIKRMIRVGPRQLESRKSYQSVNPSRAAPKWSWSRWKLTNQDENLRIKTKTWVFVLSENSTRNLGWRFRLVRKLNMKSWLPIKPTRIIVLIQNFDSCFRFTEVVGQFWYPSWPLWNTYFLGRDLAICRFDHSSLKYPF